MKKVIIILAIWFTAPLAVSQEIIELSETQLNYPKISYAEGVRNSFVVNIKETAVGEFEKDPLSFMNTHFDIMDLLAKFGDRNYESYFVTFKSRKGELNAHFNSNGSLLSTNSRFENILVPYDLAHKLYRDYKGWAMVKNVHVAAAKNGVINKDFYRVTMTKGKEKKNIKINTTDISRRDLVFN